MPLDLLLHFFFHVYPLCKRFLFNYHIISENGFDRFHSFPFIISPIIIWIILFIVMFTQFIKQFHFYKQTLYILHLFIFFFLLAKQQLFCSFFFSFIFIIFTIMLYIEVWVLVTQLICQSLF
jgi:hypothetical protein